MNMLCWRKNELECERERSQETEGRSCGLQDLWQGDLTERGCEDHEEEGPEVQDSE